MNPPMTPLTPDQRALAARHVRLAQKIARTLTALYGMFHWYDVLRSTALEALSKATLAFDPAKGPFDVFAWHRITGRVLNAIRKEARKLSFEAVLDAAEHIESESRVSNDTDEDTIAQIDSITADVMSAFVMSCVSREWAAQGEAGLLEHQAFADLTRAVSRLPPGDRRLIELRYWEDLPWREVAARLRMPERTAKDHDRKIRRALEAGLLAGVGPSSAIRGACSPA